MHFQKLGSQLETLAPQMHLAYCWTSNTLFVCLVWVVHVFLIVFGSLSSVVVLINSIHNNGLEIWRRCTLWNVSVCVIDRKKASHTRINMFLRGNQLNPIEGQLMAFFFRYFGCWCLVFYGTYIPIKNNPFVCGLGKRSTWLTGRTQRKTANSLLLMGQILIMLWGIYTFGFAFGLCQISQQLPGKHEDFLNPVHSTDALAVSAQRYFIQYYPMMITLESWTTSLHSFCIDILLLYIDSFLRHLALPTKKNQPLASATLWSLPIVWLARKASLFMGTAMVQIAMCWESIVYTWTYIFVLHIWKFWNPCGKWERICLLKYRLQN